MKRFIPVLLLFTLSLVFNQNMPARALTSATQELFAWNGPPPWAPAHGYRAKTNYVYFPAIGIYFDLSTHMYIYLEDGKWISVRTIPARYSQHDLRKLKQEELPEGLNPQMHHRGRGKGQDKEGKGRGRGRG
jgi:hypothetical protein